METRKVSAAFSKFYAKNAQAIADAKKAEARVSNCPVPVGTTGRAIITDMRFDKSKDKKNPDGTVKEGTDYCQMEFKIIDHPQHSGKTLRKPHYFSNTANATAVDRFEWFLNELEYMGLDRELRIGHDDPQQLVDFFLKEPYTVEFEILAGDPRYDDGKVLRLRRPPEEVPDIPHGDTVQYLGQSWMLLSKSGTKLKIKNPTTGNEKEIDAAQLD